MVVLLGVEQPLLLYAVQQREQSRRSGARSPLGNRTPQRSVTLRSMRSRTAA
ncbi:hypothetical protein ABZ801_35710 [Actinomadura sp. NPDC047616]|uniref:hypothetical protein n=1 Tax=Actinomadura sp. NPDC047616 TaxID=3155914 RepID=UPI0033D0FF3A